MIKKIFWRTVAIAGIAILFWVCSVVLESRASLKWPQTKGQVMSSSLTINHFPKFMDLNSDPIRWYGAEVQYKYTVGEWVYLSTRVSVNDGIARNPKAALKVMNKYRHQQEVIVYYDPSDPQKTVLEPGNVGDIYLPLMVGGLLVILGLSFLFEQTTEVKIRGIDNYLYWGNIYQKRGKLNEALREFNKIIEISPNLSQGHKSRGNLYLQTENWDEAISDFSQAISINPVDGLMYFNRANAYFGKKQYDKALVDIQKAIEKGIKVKPDVLEKIKKAANSN